MQVLSARSGTCCSESGDRDTGFCCDSARKVHTEGDETKLSARSSNPKREGFVLPDGCQDSEPQKIPVQFSHLYTDVSRCHRHQDLRRVSPRGADILQNTDDSQAGKKELDKWDLEFGKLDLSKEPQTQQQQQQPPNICLAPANEPNDVEQREADQIPEEPPAFPVQLKQRAQTNIAHWHRHLNRHAHLEELYDLQNSLQCIKRGGHGTHHTESEHEEHDWHTRKENYVLLWDKHGSDENVMLLAHLNLRIALDGGLNDRDIDSLWAPDLLSRWSRLISAGSVFVGGFCSAAYVIWLDTNIILKEHKPDAKGRFLITGNIFEVLFEKEEDRGEQLICIAEMILLLEQFMMIAWRLHRASKDDNPALKWRSVSTLFFSHMQHIYNFTAMKLLYYVTPVIFLTDIGNQVQKCGERWKHGRRWLAISSIVKFFCFRIFCVLIGCDAFLIKARANMDTFINKQHISFGIIVGLTMFLFQIVGIVDVSLFVRARLFQYLFGGTDCIMNSDERATQWFYDAMLAKKIWERHGLFRFTVIMLSFTDYDFQALTLDTKQERPSLSDLMYSGG